MRLSLRTLLHASRTSSRGIGANKGYLNARQNARPVLHELMARQDFGKPKPIVLEVRCCGETLGIFIGSQVANG
jgi:hypothetical protein